MKWRYLFKISFLQILQHLESSLVIFLALAISVMAVLHTARQMLYSTDLLIRAEEYKRTYNINLWNHDISGSKQLVETLLFGENYPVEEIDYITVYEEDVAAGNNNTVGTCRVYLEGNERYQPSIHILVGRMFTEEELENGEYVIILTEYTAAQLGAGLGDTVLFGNQSYEVIGIDDDFSNYICYGNAVGNSSASLDPDRVRLAKGCSAEEKTSFCELIESFGGNPQSVYDFQLPGFLNSTITYLIIMLLVAVCALSIIAQLFMYMMESRRHEMQIYEILGISSGCKLLVFYIPILALAVLAEAAGDILYYLSEPLLKKLGFVEQLRVVSFLPVNIFVIVVMICTVVPIYRKMEREQCLG